MALYFWTMSKQNIPIPVDGIITTAFQLIDKVTELIEKRRDLKGQIAAQRKALDLVTAYNVLQDARIEEMQKQLDTLRSQIKF